MEIFEYSFMLRAFAAGIVVAALASLLGVFVVVRRYSMLSDSLAHISLLGVAFGFLFSISLSWSAISAALAASLAIEYLRQNKNLYSDSILSVFLSGSLALAIIVVSLSNSFNASLFDYLFGSIVAVEEGEIWTVFAFGLASLLLVANYYHKLVFVSFDEETAKASGINTKMLGYLLTSLVAITVGLSIKIVGALLIGALMIIPVVSAMQFCKSFFATTVVSVIIAILSVIAGLFISYYASMPSGATIVVVSLVLFVASFVIGKASSY